MRLKTILSALVVGGVLCGMTATATAKEEAKDSSKLEAQAKVSKADAEKTALAKAPGGKVKEAELEEEDGLLVWPFDFTTPGTKDVTEVLVDAKSGKIVSVEKESPEKEAGETGEQKGRDEDKDKD